MLKHHRVITSYLRACKGQRARPESAETVPPNRRRGAEAGRCNARSGPKYQNISRSVRGTRSGSSRPGSANIYVNNVQLLVHLQFPCASASAASSRRRPIAILCPFLRNSYDLAIRLQHFIFYLARVILTFMSNYKNYVLCDTLSVSGSDEASKMHVS